MAAVTETAAGFMQLEVTRLQSCTHSQSTGGDLGSGRPPTAKTGATP